MPAFFDEDGLQLQVSLQLTASDGRPLPRNLLEGFGDLRFANEVVAALGGIF